MELKNDVERAVRYIATKDYKNPKTEKELQDILDNVVDSFKAQTIEKPLDL